MSLGKGVPGMKDLDSGIAQIFARNLSRGISKRHESAFSHMLSSLGVCSNNLTIHDRSKNKQKSGSVDISLPGN